MRTKPFHIPSKVTALVLIGLIIRALFINGHAYWFDEVVSNMIADNPLSGLIRTSAVDNYPPFYFVILKYLYVFSRDHIVLRMSSVLMGVLALIVSYYVFLELSNKQTAILATAFMVISPLHIYFSTELRMYALLVLELLTFTWVFLRFVQERKKVQILLLFVAGVLSLYTHYYAILYLVSLNLLVLLYHRMRSILLPWYGVQIAMALFFAPWVFYTIQFSHPACWCMDSTTGVFATFASFAIGGMGSVTFYDVFLRGPQIIKWGFLIISIFFFALFALSVFEKRITNQTKTLILFSTPLMIMSILGIWLPYFSPRSMIIISPFFYLLVANYIVLQKNKQLQRVLQQLSLLLLTIVLVVQFFSPFFYRSPV